MKKILILTLCLVLAITISACGKKTAEKAAEKAIEKSTGDSAEVNFDEGSVKINTNQGTFEAGEKVSLPSDFPSDIYVIDGIVTAATSMPENEAFTISIETSKSVSAAKEKYESELKKDGWNITMTLTLGDGATLGAEKGNRSVTVNINESDGKTMVVLGTSKTEE